MFGRQYQPGYQNPNFAQSLMSRKSTELSGNSLFNVQQPDYPLAFDQYSGAPLKMAAEIVWQTGIMDKSNFFLTDILPLEEHTGRVADLNMTVFEPTYMETNPEWSQAKLVSFSKRQRRKPLERRGIQMQMEQGFADTEYGQDTFQRYIFSIVKSQQDTLATLALFALEQAPLDLDDLMLKQDPRWAGKTMIEFMRDEIWFHGIMQDNERPFEAMDAQIRESMAFVDGNYDTLIVPSKLTGFAKSAIHTYLDAYKAGSAGPRLSKTDPTETSSNKLPGISGDLIIPLRPTYEQYRINHGSALMTSAQTVGEFYRCYSHIAFSSRFWTPDNQAIEIYDETDDTRKKIELIDILANANIFDQEGELQSLEDLKGDTGDLHLDAEKGIYDMWSNSDRTLLRFFGEMDPMQHSALDIAEFAKAVVHRMKKDAGIRPETYGNILLDIADPEKRRSQEYELLSSQINNYFPLAYSGEGIYEWLTAQEGKLEMIVSGMIVPAFRVAGVASRGSGAARSKAASVLQKALGAAPPADLTPEEEELAASIYAANLAHKKSGGTGSLIASTTLQNRNPAAWRRAYQTGVSKLSAKDQQEHETLKSAYLAILAESNQNAGSASNQHELVYGKSFNKHSAKAVYDEWSQNPAHAPSLVPGNPEYPYEPISYEALESYFGQNAHRNWDEQVVGCPAVHYTLLEAHRLAAEDPNNEAGLYELQSKVSPHLRSFMQSASIGATKEQNERLVQPRARYFPSKVPFAKVKEAASAFSSSNFTKNLELITATCSGLVRVVALTFLFTKINMNSYARWHACGLPLPAIQGVIFRPNITHKVSHAIACMRGKENLGKTLIAQGKFTYGSDPGPQSLMGHYTFYSLAHVEKPWNVSLLPAVTVDEYKGGKGTQWIDLTREMTNQSHPEESMLAHIIPLRAEMPMVSSITGSTYDLDRAHDHQLREEPYFPQALRFRATMRTWDMYTTDLALTAQRQDHPQRNFICLPGKYWFRSESEFTNVHEGKGHFKNTDGPGAKAIRSGALSQYNQDAGGANRY